jgi:hypothetical protein
MPRKLCTSTATTKGANTSDEPWYVTLLNWPLKILGFLLVCAVALVAVGSVFAVPVLIVLALIKYVF